MNTFEKALKYMETKREYQPGIKDIVAIVDDILVGRTVFERDAVVKRIVFSIIEKCDMKKGVSDGKN